MARKYARDNRGRFASRGGGATARGGRLKTASGKKRATQTMQADGAKSSGAIKGRVKRDPAAAGKIGAAKPTSRKDQLAAGAKKRNAQADRIDAKVKKLEGEYRSKDAAFYTQGVKPAARDRMIAKSQQAAQLREQSAALRSKAANAEKMSQRVKGTAASKKQERRNAFDAAGYKVGDTVTTRQYGTQKITKISKNSVSFDKGNTQDKAFMANYLGLQATSAAAKPVSSKGARLGGSRRTTNAAAPKNTTANRTGQSKTLNRFNSRPVGTMVAGKGINLVPSTKRVPLDIQGKRSDEAFARMATKSARVRARSVASRIRKVDLSQAAFESRASKTEKRARAAEKAVQGADRSNPRSRRAFNRADALRSAADSYSSLARRGRTGDLSAATLFQGRSRQSTAPKLTRSQKATATRQANKERKFYEQMKAAERARRS